MRSADRGLGLADRRLAVYETDFWGLNSQIMRALAVQAHSLSLNGRYFDSANFAYGLITVVPPSFEPN